MLTTSSQKKKILLVPHYARKPTNKDSEDRSRHTKAPKSSWGLTLTFRFHSTADTTQSQAPSPESSDGDDGDKCNRLLSYPIIAACISKINNEPAWS